MGCIRVASYPGLCRRFAFQLEGNMAAAGFVRRLGRNAVACSCGTARLAICGPFGLAIAAV